MCVCDSDWVQVESSFKAKVGPSPLLNNQDVQIFLYVCAHEVICSVEAMQTLLNWGIAKGWPVEASSLGNPKGLLDL